MWGKAHAQRVPFEELRTNSLFEIADDPRQGGLRDMQLFGGPPERAGLCDGHKG
jgi:hypothetical protein